MSIVGYVSLEKILLIILHTLIIYNLVSKASGKYRLTLLGKLVFDWHLVFMYAISQE